MSLVYHMEAIALFQISYANKINTNSYLVYVEVLNKNKLTKQFIDL